jgi:putative hemolysin
MTFLISRIDNLVASVFIALLIGCTRPSAPVASPPPAPGPAAQRANPASQHCVEQGGKLTIERGPGGGQYGVCTFSDNRQCEEWALLRGECPRGGVQATGYATAAARYCAITGGRYTVVARSGTADEQGTCALPSGKTCDAGAYYRGTCSRDGPKPDPGARR